MTRGRHKEFDRDEVLTIARNEFWKNGYEATGLTALLESMGIGRQSLYRTFGDKRGLFIEALNQYSEEVVGRHVSILKGPGSGLANIKKLFREISRRSSDELRMGCMLANAAAEHGFREDEIGCLTKQHLSRLKAAFSDAIGRGQAAGEIRSDLDADKLACTIVATLQGTALLARLPDNRPFVRHVLSGTMELLSESI